MPLPQNTFAPKNKTKGLFDKTKALMSKRKHEQSFCYAPSRECGCILSIQFFSGNSSRGWRRRKYAGIIHIPGCICHFALGFCKNIKKRTETLYQSFSPFMVEPIRSRRQYCPHLSLQFSFSGSAFRDAIYAFLASAPLFAEFSCSATAASMAARSAVKPRASSSLIT